MRSIDRLSVLQTVADALGVLVAELRGEEADDSTTAELPEAFGSLRFAPTGHPALDVVLGTDLQAITNERLDQLRNLHAQPLAHASRYGELAPLVANLIPELEHAVRAATGAAIIEAVRELLSDTYQAVAAVTAKLDRRTPRGSPQTGPRSSPRHSATPWQSLPACSAWPTPS